MEAKFRHGAIGKRGAEDLEWNSNGASKPYNLHEPVLQAGKKMQQSFPEWLMSRLFGSLDTNGDGALDANEIPEALVKHYESLDHQESNDDSKLTKKEMAMATALAMFDALDADGDGNLDANELDATVIAGIEKADGDAANDNGKLDIAEFVAAYGDEGSAFTCARPCNSRECEANDGKACGPGVPFMCTEGRAERGCSGTAEHWGSTRACTECCDAANCHAAVPPSQADPHRRRRGVNPKKREL
jgi:Ca2+-binding EF-hand superfamily protein